MKITPQLVELVEQQMEKDDETTAIQLQNILVDSNTCYHCRQLEWYC